jgi:hypothetical protein
VASERCALLHHAEDQYLQAIAIAPDRPEAYFDLAILYETLCASGTPRFDPDCQRRAGAVFGAAIDRAGRDAQHAELVSRARRYLDVHAWDHRRFLRAVGEPVPPGPPAPFRECFEP